MTLCAGLCRWEAGGYISIRMSEPLLKFRTKKDYIETLLHEMIHAYLFLVGSKKEQDRDAHGEEFLREAKRVSQAAGVNITVFHTFHDEVDHYRKHIWKCTGPCQHRPPYFGLVKRAMNRPPQKADRWWSEHERTCGGSYIKIAGPDMEGDGTSGRKDKGKRRAATDGVGIDGKDGALAKPNEVRRKKPKTDGNNTTDSKVQLKIDDLLFGEKRRS
ncbi:SprT-like family-domain-containing protein [Gaertneriomyces semiglobifer]|nr:SprT-like family-domain-containing protein [Gaertneriomyces semiglobifer]